MKKLFIVLAIVLFATTAQAWTIQWDALSETPDMYNIRYKTYPAGYDYPANPAPQADVEANPFNSHDNGTVVSLADFETALGLETNVRYVFHVQALAGGDIVAVSDYLCWTYPDPDGPEVQVIEIPLKSIKKIILEITNEDED